jgi:hypothetical protein
MFIIGNRSSTDETRDRGDSVTQEDETVVDSEQGNSVFIPTAWSEAGASIWESS